MKVSDGIFRTLPNHVRIVTRGRERPPFQHKGQYVVFPHNVNLRGHKNINTCNKPNTILLTNHNNMAITDPKDMQKPQEPSARVGDGQEDRVPTHEGSQLGAPEKAQIKDGGKVPHV